MRVLLDTNILISYLLHPDSDSPVVQIVEAAVLGHFTLLLPEALLAELAARIATKPYLAQRIKPEQLAQLADILRDVAVTVPRIAQAIPAVTRDPKDDYLLAYALVGHADCLVTGDDDLLALGNRAGIAILSPRAFWETFSG